MSGLEVYASDSSGSLLGSGPITTATTAQSTVRLSLVGDVSLDLPATDPACAVLVPSTKPWIRIYGERELSVVEVGYGQLLSSSLSVDGREQTRTYTGPDQLGLLNNRTVGRLKLSNGSGGPQTAATVLASILAFVTGWTATGVPSADTYLELAGETVFGTLVKVADQLGDAFYLSGPKTITWLPKTTPYVATGLTARSDVDPVDVESNPLILLIDGEVERTEEYDASATRLFPEGSGNRSAAINLLKCTRFGAPGTGVTGDYTSGDYTLHIEAGAADQCYIRYNPGEPTADDIVELRKDYKDIGAAGTTTADGTSVTNALFDVAYADLQRMINPAKTYRFKVARCAVDITVGTTLVLDIHRYAQIVDDLAYYTYAAILDTCLITEIQREVDRAGQVQIGSLTVTPNNRPILGTTMNTLATVVGQVQNLTRHFQKAEAALFADQATTATSATLTGLIRDNGTNLTRRAALNLIGLGFTVVDDAANDETEIHLNDAAALMFMRDDFACRSVATSGALGELGWSFGGFTSFAATAGAAFRPGMVRGTSPATTATLCYMHVRETPGTGIILFADSFDLTWVLRFAPTGVITNYDFRCGLAANASSANGGATGEHIEFLAADTNWFYVARSASTDTRTDLGIAKPSATNYVKLRMRKIDATHVGVTIGANAEVSVTVASIPASQCQPYLQVVPQENAAKTLDLDFFALKVTGLAR